MIGFIPIPKMKKRVVPKSSGAQGKHEAARKGYNHTQLNPMGKGSNILS